MRAIALHLLAALSLVTFDPLLSAHAQSYVVTNLVSDGSVSALVTDPNFLNPWGISVSGTWWISTADSGLNYVISSATDAVAFEVIVPAATGSGTGSPAGSVTTTGASGMVLSNGAKASFLFATLDGAIFGWNSKLGGSGSVAIAAINNASAGASYPGLAIINPSATTSYILAPNFGAAATVEVYDQNFKPAKLSGSFTDPNLPSGYAPYSIHILHNQVWVAYAAHSSSAPYVPLIAAGNGIVDVFDTSGNFVARAVTGGNLNAPWGVAFAPANFGVFSGDLLIGNFGDGMINVYDPKTYAYLGQLVDSTATPLSYEALWDILAGGTPVMNSSSSSGGNMSAVYFTAGLSDQQHGLLGAITYANVSDVSPIFAFSSSTSTATVTSGNSMNIALAVVPVNGFSGNVTFSCDGLPTGSTCVFQPASLNVTSSAVATSTLTITTMGSGTTTMGRLRTDPIFPALASLLPVSLLLLVRRRRLGADLRVFGPLVVLILGYTCTAFFIGCSSSPPTVNPLGTTSTVTVTAKSSSGMSQEAVVGLIVH